MGESHRASILVVDDEIAMQELLCDLLEENGFAVTAVGNGADMNAALAERPFSMVILDLRLKGEDGLTVARRLREASTIPIMMLTGKGDETDRIVGLELAADDFLMKPFNNRELLARVRAMLRRSTTLNGGAGGEEGHERYRFDRWVLDLSARELRTADGDVRPLTQAEFALLEAFVRTPNRVLSRDQLLAKTRGYDAEVFDRTIDVLILRLRRKIEPNPQQPRFIRTERGLGYVFCARVTQC